MIRIQTDRQSFAYDIHSLVKAFYPEQEVHVEREVYEGQNSRAGQDAPPSDSMISRWNRGQNSRAGQDAPPSDSMINSWNRGQNSHAGQDVPPGAGSAAKTGKSEQEATEAPEEETRQSLRLVVSFVTAESAQEQETTDATAENMRERKSANATAESARGREAADAAAETENEAETESGCTISVRFLENGEVLRQGETAVAPGTKRREVKNELKRLLYRMLQEQTGRTLPWGTLTGIRPTKIPMSLLDQGWKNAQIAQYMRDTYYCGNEKTALAVAIANRERHILEGLDLKNGYSLYIGIPFCPSICLYCSFSSSPLHLWKDQVDTYLDALCREIDYVSEELSGRVLNTVYIGGGTPTTLEPYQLERLLTKLEQSFDLGKLREFTVEAGRPDSITREKLQVLKEHGITRISINPQTMNQKTLDLIGRKHTVEETVDAFRLARGMGFDNINMDLIVGLPGEGLAEVEHTMQELAKLDPDSVTVHSLAVKRASRLKRILSEFACEQGGCDEAAGKAGSGSRQGSAAGTRANEVCGAARGADRIPAMTNSREIMELTASCTRQSGLFPYYLYRQKNMAGNFENVGYAREGKEGIYNILIMEEMQSIFALGAGASTKLVFAKDRIERIENVKDIRNYIDRIDEMIERKRSVFHG